MDELGSRRRKGKGRKGQRRIREGKRKVPREGGRWALARRKKA